MRRGIARLVFRLGLRRLGTWLWPTPRIERLDVASIVSRYRVRADGGAWISGPMGRNNPGHWTSETQRHTPRWPGQASGHRPE